MERRDASASAATACAGRDENELYNGGTAFKITCRDARGVMVTIIADNYYGYCKKEVKTQISYSANLFGLCEEEHAGGALVFPSYDLGEDFTGKYPYVRGALVRWKWLPRYGDRMRGSARGLRHRSQVIPTSSTCRENAAFRPAQAAISWAGSRGEP